MKSFLIIALLVQMRIVLTEPKDTNYWSRTTDKDTSWMIILNEVSTVSLPSCVSLCKQTANCSMVYTIKRMNSSVACSLLSETGTANRSNNNLAKGNTYKLSRCVNPCDVNPCRKDFVCIRRPHPNCYDCICTDRKEGDDCERCIENYAGPNCDVNVTGSKLLDGIYFYIPEGVINGHEVGPELQPNCSDSRAMCAERGMKLLTIKTKEKNDTVVKLGLHNDGCKTCFYQLGLHRLNLTEPYRWDSGELLGNVTNWQWSFLFEFPDYSYVAFAPNIGYKWVNTNCDFLAVYICEYDPNE